MLAHMRQLLKAAKGTSAERRMLRRTYEFQMLARLSPTVEVRSADLRYFINTGDQAVGRAVFLEGEFDERYMAKAVRLIEQTTGKRVRGSTMLDIGANIGTSTLLALRRHDFGQVVAFEPDPTNFDLLKLNTVANDLADRTTLHQVGLSDRAATMTLSRSPSNHGDRRLRTDFNPTTASLYDERSWPTAEVEVVTLDSIDVDFTDVGAVWMDVQGHEAHVLDGATALLSSDVPIVTEYSPHLLQQAGSLDRFHAILEKHAALVIDVRADLRYPGAEATERLGSTYESSTRAFTDLVLLTKRSLPSTGGPGVV